MYSAPLASPFAPRCAIVEQQDLVITEHLRIVLLGEHIRWTGKSESLSGPPKRQSTSGFVVNHHHHVHVPKVQENVAILLGLEAVVMVSIKQWKCPLQEEHQETGMCSDARHSHVKFPAHHVPPRCSL